MSVILSLILNEISFHEKVSNHKLFSNEIHGIQLIEMKAFIILFLDDVKRRRKISQKDLGVQLKIIATKGNNSILRPCLSLTIKSLSP